MPANVADRPTGIGHRTRVGQKRRARTEARIVAAALQVFAERGTDAPVIDDFIHAAGVARGTFYNYFTHTGQLLAAVTRALEDELILAIEHEMAGLTAPVERLSAGMRLWLRWALADRQGCGFVVRSRFRGPLVEQRLALDLQGGLQSGVLRGIGADTARDLVVGTILAAMNRMLEQDVPDAYCDEVAAAILRALGVPPRTVARLLQAPVATLRLPGGQATAPSSPP
jgi:AcrR family transcriptional regulator